MLKQNRAGRNIETIKTDKWQKRDVTQYFHFYRYMNYAISFFLWTGGRE